MGPRSAGAASDVGRRGRQATARLEDNTVQGDTEGSATHETNRHDHHRPQPINAVEGPPSSARRQPSLDPRMGCD